MKKFIIEWLNRQGLFTFKQYAEKLDEVGALKDYAHHLEQSIDGMADPAKPIVVIGQNTNVCDVILQYGQQVIVSPYAKFTRISNVWVKPAVQATHMEVSDAEIRISSSWENVFILGSAPDAALPPP